MAGVDQLSNFPVTAGAPHPSKPVPAGDEDMFIAKFATTPGTPVSLPGTLAFNCRHLCRGRKPRATPPSP